MEILTAAGVGRTWLLETAARLSEWLANLLFEAPGLLEPVLGPFSMAHVASFLGCVILVAAVHGLLAFALRRLNLKRISLNDAQSWRELLCWALSVPAYLVLWIYGVYFALAPLSISFTERFSMRHPPVLVDTMMDLGLFAACLWVFIRLTKVFERRLSRWARGTESAIDDLIIPLAASSLRVILPAIGIVLALPLINLPPDFGLFVRKSSQLLIILVVAGILLKTVASAERIIMSQIDLDASDNLQARRIYTQMHVLKRTLYVIIGVLTLVACLMLFEGMRHLATSILASAGVAGVIIGFAAQRSIANLFAGLQVAITQPIRIDDVVIVENEWGRIEEITLTYVVVRIWDLRRLVVPLSYFIEKPFQNWTRTSANLLGTVFIYSDYTVPVDAVREELKRIVEQSPNWDRKVVGLQVTNTNAQAMELRALASSADASKGWDLRCEIREKLIAFLQRNYPDSLPKVRLSSNPDLSAG